MIKLIVKNKDMILEVKRGTRLKDILDDIFDFDLQCKANGVCGSCKVRILEGDTGEIHPSELLFIDKDRNERLACQVILKEDTIIEFDDEFNSNCISLNNLVDIPLDGSIKIKKLKLIKGKEQALVDRIKENLSSIEIYQKLGELDYSGKVEHMGVIYGRELIDIKKDLSKPLLGFAIDIGTTTISYYFVNLLYGSVIGKYAIENPIIRLIDQETVEKHLDLGNERVAELHEILIDSINEGVEFLLGSNYNKEDIYHYVVAGCNFMNHLFLGINPKLLCDDIETSIFWDIDYFKGDRVRLTGNKNSIVNLVSANSNIIGGDVISGLVATDFINQNNTIYLDIGNTVELLLSKDNKIYGTRICESLGFKNIDVECGSVDEDGSIIYFDLDEDYRISYKTMANKEALGIAVSGFMHIVNKFLEKELIDMEGKFTDKMKENCGEFLRDEKFYIVGDLYVDEKILKKVMNIIFEVQDKLMSFLEERKMKIEDIKKIYISGIYGHKSTSEIVIIPEGFKGELDLFGGASLEGARTMLVNRHYVTAAEKLSERIESIKL